LVQHHRRFASRRAAKLISEPHACKERASEMISPPESGPLLPAVVHRKRLHRLLDRVAAPGIVVVNAQAAQGKTTLIADYLKATGARSCWMALGPDDADPLHFSQHLVHICMPYSDPETITSDSKSRPATAKIIASLLSQLPPDLNLVFDDWHRIGSPALAVRRIKAIAAARPAQGRVYFITRENLPIELQRKRMRRQALVLSDDDLAFTEEEISFFFHTINGIDLDADCRQKIHRLTDGWAGALVILAEELHRCPGREEEILSAPTLSERLEIEAGNFFKEEVYGRQSKPLKAFLARSALLDRVPSDLMRVELEGHHVDHFLFTALRRHLFVKSIDAPSDQWILQINPLFRNFLRAQAPQLLSEEEIHLFLIQAARYYQTKGDLELAATYYLQANEVDEAARTITTMGIKMMIDGRFDAIAQWLDRLSPSTIADAPWLKLLQAAVFRIRGGHRTIAELQSAHQMFVEEKHVRGQMFALAYLIETGIFAGHEPEALQTWLDEGECLLRKTGRLPHFTYAKALLWQQIGLGVLSQYGGDLQKGLSACENAVVLGKRIGNHPLVVNALTVAAHAHVQAGEFDQARKRLSDAQDLGNQDRFQEYGALRSLAEFHLALIGARMTAAAEWLEKMHAAIDTFGLISLYPAYLEASGILQIRQKEHASLEKTQRHLHDVAILLNNPIYRATGFWLAGLSGYHQEHYRQAGVDLRHAMAISGLPPTHRARNRSLMGFIALNSGQFAEAGAYFSKALTVFEKKGLALYACEAHLGMALLQNACRNTAAAGDSLDTAFKTAAARRYELLPLIRPADLARACVLSIQLNIPAAVDHARHLLAKRLDDAEIDNMASSKTAEPFIQSIDARETHRAIYRARIPVLAIRTLGGLKILRNGTDPLNTRSWQGSRPALLLKAILVHGSRHIPKDILIEAVWPDRQPDLSLQNFKVTLHRLRKLMEPGLDPSRGSAYVHLKDNLVSLDKRLCDVDTDALHRLFKRIRRTDTRIGIRELLAMRRDAFTLYQGDFLPEEPYLTWAEIKRTTLRQEFIQFMYRLGRRLQDQHEFGAARGCYRRIIQIDPGQEKAYRHLMQLLDKAGRSQEVLKIFHDLQAFLQTEIGAAPDETTTKLFRTIRDRQRSG
jgi:DNA-binding SARP family transcriptional activator